MDKRKLLKLIEKGEELALDNMIKHKLAYSNSDLMCLTNSEVVNTLTTNCSLKCGSFDQIGIFFFDNDNAKYSVSSLSEMSSFAFIKNISNCSFGIKVIFPLNSSNSLLLSSIGNFENALISSWCSFNSSSRYIGAYNSSDLDSNNSLIVFEPSKAEINIEASNIISIGNHLSSGYNFLYLSCSDLFTFLPSLIDCAKISCSSFESSFSSSCSSSSNLILFTNSFTTFAKASLNSSFNSIGMSTLINTSGITNNNPNKYINVPFHYSILDKRGVK